MLLHASLLTNSSIMLTLNVDLDFGLHRAQTVAGIAAILARILHLRPLNDERPVVVQMHLGRRLLVAHRLIVERPFDARLWVTCGLGSAFVFRVVNRRSFV